MCQEFVENLADLNDGQNFPRDLLLAIYSAIKKGGKHRPATTY
jgi:hypothetical protein